MISGIATAILLVAFIVGCVWAYSPRRRSEFDSAARLALDERATAATAARETSP